MTPAQCWRWRFYADSLIEQAISILDALDGEADLEDSGDRKVSLAYPGGGESQISWSAGSDDDREMRLCRWQFHYRGIGHVLDHPEHFASDPQELSKSSAGLFSQ